MRFLAQLLEVDEAWLSIGTTPEMTRQERQARTSPSAVAANLLLGFVQLDGGACAYPDERDPRGDIVDFYAIIRGAQYAFHASLAHETGPDAYRFSVPANHEQALVIGVVRLPDLKADFIELATELIDRHKVRWGGYFEVEVRRAGEQYVTGEDGWPHIRTIAQRL